MFQKKFLVFLTAVCLLSTSAFGDPSATVSVNPNSVVGVPSQTVDIEVLASTAEDIVFMQFVLEYDSAIASFDGVTLHPSMPGGFGITNIRENQGAIQSPQADANVIVQLSGNGVTDMFTGTQTIAVLSFTITPDACGNSSIEFNSICQATHLTTFGLTTICDPVLLNGNIDTNCTTDTGPSRATQKLTVWPNTPNPFNPSTSIRFELAEASHVNLRVFDARGRVVRTLIESHRSQGMYEVSWNGTDDSGEELPSGVYFYQVSTAEESQTNRMLMLK